MHSPPARTWPPTLVVKATKDTKHSEGFLATRDHLQSHKTQLN